MFNNYLKKICLSACAVMTIASCVIPLNKVEAKGEGALAVAAGIGAICGAAITANSQHRHRQHRVHIYNHSRQVITRQQQTMDFVLSTYHPANHDAWVHYIIVDCSQVLNPIQQKQLIEVLNQRRDEKLGLTMPHTPARTFTPRPSR